MMQGEGTLRTSGSQGTLPCNVSGTFMHFFTPMVLPGATSCPACPKVNEARRAVRP